MLDSSSFRAALLGAGRQQRSASSAAERIQVRRHGPPCQAALDLQAGNAGERCDASQTHMVAISRYEIMMSSAKRMHRGASLGFAKPLLLGDRLIQTTHNSPESWKLEAYLVIVA